MNRSRYKTGIGCLVKTPGVSPVKTRLAKSIGEKEALRVYRGLLKATETSLAESEKHGIQPYWAVAENECLEDPIWDAFPCLYQGEGGLGERLDAIYRQLIRSHKYAILIGADCPTLTVSHVLQTLALLESYQWVVGPSLDGGFYLFAGKAPLSLKFWKSIPYSVPTTFAALQKKLSEKSTAILEPLRDIDTAEDLNASPSLKT